ncbi:uncharacterized protein METZ01_LOCUS339128, partial [marine metagenome]
VSFQWTTWSVPGSKVEILYQERQVTGDQCDRMLIKRAFGDLVQLSYAKIQQGASIIYFGERTVFGKSLDCRLDRFR